MHDCTTEDWKRFYEPEKNNEKTIKKLMGVPGAKCLNKLDTKGRAHSIKVFGSEFDSDHRRFEASLSPCTPIQRTDKNKHLEETMCLGDLTT